MSIFGGRGDGEIWDKGLVQECCGEEEERVGGREGGGVGGFYEVRVNVFWLVTVLENKVLEEGVCGEWRGEEVLGEEV